MHVGVASVDAGAPGLPCRRILHGVWGAVRGHAPVWRTSHSATGAAAKVLSEEPTWADCSGGP